MKIESLKLKSGEVINLNKITVLVGSNNVGKSRVLKDIRDLMVFGTNAKPIILNKINFKLPQSVEEIFKDLNIYESPSNIQNKIVKGLGDTLLKTEQFEYNPENLKAMFDQDRVEEIIMGNISKFKIALLDSSTRLNLAKSSTSFNPLAESPQNIIQSLYLNKDTESSLQTAFKDAFESEIKLDYSELQNFCLRVAKKLPEIPEDPQKAISITKDLEKIDDQGDGYRSFVGIIMGLLLSKERVILLDEPEAFLHQAQARYLGKWIVDNAENFEGQLIIATHNSNFLSGILSNDKAVEIYRLNRKENLTSFNLISAATNKKLSKSPLLSSQRVLEAIFHKGVVVCEADADRAVYHGVSLVNLGNQEILFLHAHNKQSLKNVAEVLKEAKIPVAVIADIDILNSSDDLKNLLSTLTSECLDTVLAQQKIIISAINGKPEKETLEKLTQTIYEFCEQLEKKEHNLSGAKGALNRISQSLSKWGDIKEHGLNAFPDDVRGEAISIVNSLKKIGLFIVPVGELEGWISISGIKQKNKWIIPALEIVYTYGSPGQLVDFVKEIIVFLNNS